MDKSLNSVSISADFALGLSDGCDGAAAFSTVFSTGFSTSSGDWHETVDDLTSHMFLFYTGTGLAL